MTQEEINSIGIENLICRDPYHDPKVTFIQGRAFHREKQYFIPEDEPIYIIRGSDPTAFDMVKYYNLALKEEEATEIVTDHITTSNERLDAFKLYSNNSNYFNLNKMVDDYNGKSEVTELIVSNSLNSNLPMQDLQFVFVDFRLFDVIANKFLPDDEPVITFRGKDALLVQIIDKHNELLEKELSNIRGYVSEFGSDEDLDIVNYIQELMDLNEKRKQMVKYFHINKPDRVGVTCAIFQKPKSIEYINSLKEVNNEKH